MKCTSGHQLKFIDPLGVWRHPDPTSWCSAPQRIEPTTKPNPPAGPSPVGRLDVEAIEAQRAHELELARAVSQAVIVGPDDYLLLAWKNASTAQLEAIRAKLREQHPGVADRILIANGPDTVAVIKTHGEENDG
jgi:hypothetical protein